MAAGHWTEVEARAALREFARSGQSAAAFARAHGFSTERLRYWRKRIGGVETVPFVAVRLGSPSAGHIEIVCDEVVVRVREELPVERVVEIALGLAAGRTRRC